MGLERFVSFLILSLSVLSASSVGSADTGRADYTPGTPSSQPAEDRNTGLTLAFCAEWDPEFSFRGAQCCNVPARPKGRFRRRAPQCNPSRAKGQFCEEMTPEQKKYIETIQAGKGDDVLNAITRSLDAKPRQAFCTVNHGFLVNGRALVETPFNRVRLRAPHRCTQFGTDAMIGMLEWVGRKVSAQYAAPEFSKLRLLVGDISAPRGGCLAGRGGRRGHASHTNGQDADIGFLWAKPNSAPPDAFTQKFDPGPNWWLLKQIFQNPYACVKVIFLDRRHIAKLAKEAKGDPDWDAYRKFIRHVKAHKNHFHVRIGDHPGMPGCELGADPELEIEDEDGDGPAPFNLLEELGISF